MKAPPLFFPATALQSFKERKKPCSCQRNKKTKLDQGSDQVSSLCAPGIDVVPKGECYERER